MTLTWKDRLRTAKAANKFSEEDTLLSSNFRTCAVGEMDGGIGELGFHPDIELRRLGYDFHWAVGNNDVAKAQSIYNEINKSP